MTSTPDTPPAPTPTLSAIEARVLGTLMEKARTVPDSYPLTLNSLLLGCNQKSSREPLMELDEAEVASALDNLKNLNLVRESSSGRSTRFEHNFQRGIGVYEQAAVLLGLLILRGPQTAGELRLNAERWYKFADISSVEGFSEEGKAHPAVEILQQFASTASEDSDLRAFWFGHLIGQVMNLHGQAGLRFLGTKTVDRVGRRQARAGSMNVDAEGFFAGAL